MNKPDSEHPAITAGPLRYHAGEVIGGKYRLEELMGEGGMGTVWRAHNQSLGVDVAVKLTHGELLDDDTAARLELEAHAAAKLDHPAAVKVFDLGHTELGDPFIVMELLRGKSLRDILDRSGVDVFLDVDDSALSPRRDRKLKNALRECAAFVPVMSARSPNAARRFLQKEWVEAILESARAAPSFFGATSWVVWRLGPGGPGEKSGGGGGGA